LPAAQHHTPKHPNTALAQQAALFAEGLLVTSHLFFKQELEME
jgi:hypothetical protein